MNSQSQELYIKVLANRVAAANGVPGTPTFGKHDYDTLRLEFRPSTGPATRLRVADTNEPIDEDLSTALEGLQAAPRHYANILNFLSEGPALNQRSFVLLSHQVLKTNPHTDHDSCLFIITCLKFVKRTGADQTFPAAWALLRPHCDEAMCASYAFCKLACKPLDLWWQGKRQFADLIVPVSECDGRMAVITDFSGVKQDLYRVVCTKVGAKMFGAAPKELQRSKLGLRTHRTLQQLDVSEITEALIRTQREAFLTE